MKNDDLEHFDEELFDSLDEAGRHAVAAVFLSTPSIPKTRLYVGSLCAEVTPVQTVKHEPHPPHVA